MSAPVPLQRLVFLCAASFLLFGSPALRAQFSSGGNNGGNGSGGAPITPAPAPSSDALNSAELLRSYLQLENELRSAQSDIVKNRLEADAAARAQAVTTNEKLDAMKASMDAERDRRIADLQRAQADHDALQAEMQRSNRTILWVACLFGIASLLAMLATALFQWRTLKRLAAQGPLQAALPAPPPMAFLPADAHPLPGGQVVAQSSQQLLSVIDRMEHRIKELEHTAVRPVPAAPSPAIAPPTSASAPGPMPASAPSNAGNGFGPTNGERVNRVASLLADGRAALKSGRAMDALGRFDEVLKLEPNHPEALVRKGKALERLKQDQEAIRCYDRAIEADRKMTLAYLSKGGLFNRLERFSEAVECYERAAQIAEEGK